MHRTRRFVYHVHDFTYTYISVSAGFQTSKQPVLNKSSESYDAGSVSAFKLSLPASSVVGFSIPTPPPSSR
ncbi:hypothetical protein BJV77DRAFT_1025073, partial [Russula vinacea]